MGHSCLVFLLRNSWERGLKPCTWLCTASEIARSNKIITLKIGPQLFTKCSTTDPHLTLDLRETLLISKCSIFILIMILIMFYTCLFFLIHLVHIYQDLLPKIKNF